MFTTAKIGSLFVSIALILPGCGASILSTRATNPVVQDYLGYWPGTAGALGTLSPDASRRITFIRMGDTKQDYSSEKWHEGEFCAEPPADAMVNASSQFTEALAATIKAEPPTGGGAAAEGSGSQQMVQQIATVMSPLLRRSQGLQWSRDNLAFVCNMHLNRIITKDKYLELVKKIMDDSKEVMLKEMNHLPVFEYKIAGAPVGPTILTQPSLIGLPNK